MVAQSQFIEMFGDLSLNSKQWPTGILGSIADIKIGPFGSLLHQQDYVIGGHPLVNPSQIVDNQIVPDSKVAISDSKFKDLASYALRVNDVVLGRRGEMGRAGIVKQEGMLCGTGSMFIRAKEDIDSYFIHQLLISPVYKEVLTRNSVGTTMMNLNTTIVSSLIVPILPVDLKKSFIGITRQADKSKFDGLKSQFISQFGNPITNPMGWSTKPLCQVAPESPSNTKMKGRVWVLNLDMIESNSGCIINKVFEDSDDLNSVAAFDEGNVLFSKLRPYLNKVTIPDEKGYATTELVPLRPHTDELRQYFLSFLLRTDEFVKYADGIATGTKMPRMPMTALREFKCILPPTELQDLFCGISKQADKSKLNAHNTFLFFPESVWVLLQTFHPLLGGDSLPNS